MSPTDVLGEAWGLYKRHWRHLIPIALVVYATLALLSLLLVWLLGWLGAFISFFVGLVGLFWLQGALVIAVQDVRDGRPDLSIGETLGRVRPRLPPLIVAGILAGLGITIGLILLIVPGLYLATIWLVVIPVVMLEGRPAAEAFGRSRELVRGNGWNAFGLIVLTFLLLLLARFVIAVILTPLNNSIQAYVTDVVANTLTAPFVAAALTVAYFHLHELARAPAEPVAAGTPPQAPPPSPSASP